jgi:hypothetical protein
MKYETLKGELLDLSSFEENELVGWLRREYDSAKSWIEFHQRTSNGVIEEAKRLVGEKWQGHYLVTIQADLAANKGAELGELKGKNSRMFYE